MITNNHGKSLKMTLKTDVLTPICMRKHSNTGPCIVPIDKARFGVLVSDALGLSAVSGMNESRKR